MLANIWQDNVNIGKCWPIFKQDSEQIVNVCEKFDFRAMHNWNHPKKLEEDPENPDETTVQTMESQPENVKT